MTLTLFSAAYAAAAFILFHILPRRIRIPFLCAASLLYVYTLDRTAFLFLIVTIPVFYLTGKAIAGLKEKGAHKKAKTAAGLCIAISLLLLAALKFLPFFAGMRADGTFDPLITKLFVPLGFSFYLFQAVSYLAEMVRGSIGQPRFMEFVLYLSWFPKFISGPIEKPDAFIGQLREISAAGHKQELYYTEALFGILYGIFLKIVIADRFGMYADTIFESPQAFSSAWILLGILMYTLQIYCDFAGYSAAAVGFSLLFGIRLKENFRTPYLSSNINDFWRRWHISLSTWLRDYLYIPLGGNRKGTARRILNTMIVFIVCGLWHGAGAGFLIWGILHGVYSALDYLIRTCPAKWLQFLRNGMTGRILTFIAVSFAWIFFRCGTLQGSSQLLYYLFTAGPRWHSFPYEMEALGINQVEYSVMAGLVLMVLACDIPAFIKDRSFPQLLSKAPLIVKCLAVYLLLTGLIILGIYGTAYTGGRLIYMQF